MGIDDGVDGDNDGLIDVVDFQRNTFGGLLYLIPRPSNQPFPSAPAPTQTATALGPNPSATVPGPVPTVTARASESNKPSSSPPISPSKLPSPVPSRNRGPLEVDFDYTCTGSAEACCQAFLDYWVSITSSNLNDLTLTKCVEIEDEDEPEVAGAFIQGPTSTQDPVEVVTEVYLDNRCKVIEVIPCPIPDAPGLPDLRVIIDPRPLSSSFYELSLTDFTYTFVSTFDTSDFSTLLPIPSFDYSTSLGVYDYTDSSGSVLFTLASFVSSLFITLLFI